MVISKGAVLSSHFYNLALLARGGLAQVTSHPGGSTTRFALSCLSSFLEKSEGDPSLSIPLSLWISDEGSLYPAGLKEQGPVLLSRILLIQVNSPQEVWRVGLESVQTGLFDWVLLRPSRPCPLPFLRKLQLSSERMRSRVLILTRNKLPHWTLKAHFQVSAEETYANSIYSKRSIPTPSR